MAIGATGPPDSGRHPELPKRVTYLLQEQRGRCACCDWYFQDTDVLEVDHIIPITHGGRDEASNLQLLHGHCHDLKTAADRSAAAGALDTSQTIEEPDRRETGKSGSKAGGGAILSPSHLRWAEPRRGGLHLHEHMGHARAGSGSRDNTRPP